MLPGLHSQSRTFLLTVAGAPTKETFRSADYSPEVVDSKANRNTQSGCGGALKGSKQFFFEKKNQKTFVCVESSLAPASRVSIEKHKVFL
jgi:hypothetical protein